MFVERTMFNSSPIKGEPQLAKLGKMADEEKHYPFTLAFPSPSCLFLPWAKLVLLGPAEQLPWPVSRQEPMKEEESVSVPSHWELAAPDRLGLPVLATFRTGGG